MSSGDVFQVSRFTLNRHRCKFPVMPRLTPTMEAILTAVETPRSVLELTAQLSRHKTTIDDALARMLLMGIVKRAAQPRNGKSGAPLYLYQRQEA